MALVTTTVDPAVRITPFTGLSEVARERSGIARAEIVYSQTGTWPATASGDNRGLIFTWELDRNYGYVLMDCTCGFIKTTGTNAMEASGFLEIETSTGPGADSYERQYYQLTSAPSRMDNSMTAIGDMNSAYFNTMYPSGTSSSAMIFGMPIKPTGLIYPFPGVASIDCSVVFGEEPYQETSQSYRFYCRFLQYDITQGYNYVVNSPRLTR